MVREKRGDAEKEILFDKTSKKCVAVWQKERPTLPRRSFEGRRSSAKKRWRPRPQSKKKREGYDVEERGENRARGKKENSSQKVAR